MYKSTSGLGTSRLKLGYESTAFGHETTGYETTMSKKRPGTDHFYKLRLAFSRNLVIYILTKVRTLLRSDVQYA